MPDSDRILRVLQGAVGSPGIAVGLAYAIDRGKLKIPMRMIMPDVVSLEKARFRKALEQSRSQLEAAKSRDIGTEHRQILDAHITWIRDDFLLAEVEKTIETQNINAEWAVKKLFDGMKSSLKAEEDASRIERVHLFDEVGHRVMRNLLGADQESLETLPSGVVLVAHNLSPGDMALIDRKRVAGLVMDMGGPTSHTSILARGMGIPAIVGLEHVTSVLRTGDMAILDGREGKVIVNPTPDLLDEYKEKARKIQVEERELRKIKDLPCVTLDGRDIGILANLELPEEVELMQENGLKDVGLFRSEFVFLSRGVAAGEEEQYRTYSRLLKAVGPDRVVTIRTLDLGWEKLYADMDVAPETNPAMGLRAIRFCLRSEHLFKDQLRALLRASIHGRLRIMFPMISGLEELRRAKGVLEEVKQELELESREYADNVEVGIMVEVPSAVIMADVLAPEVDFFSIGTNDLIQYSLAVDRGNESVSYLFTHLHLAVLRLIEQTVGAGRRAGIEVAMCGEMAGDLQMTMILIGLGVNVLSVSPTSALRLKSLIRMIDSGEAERFARETMAKGSGLDMERFVRSELTARFPEIFKEFTWTL